MEFRGCHGTTCGLIMSGVSYESPHESYGTTCGLHAPMCRTKAPTIRMGQRVNSDSGGGSHVHTISLTLRRHRGSRDRPYTDWAPRCTSSATAHRCSTIAVHIVSTTKVYSVPFDFFARVIPGIERPPDPRNFRPPS